MAELVAIAVTHADPRGPYPTSREARLKRTAYFSAIRSRPDRAQILDEWIQRVVMTPEREEIQTDGRIRRWAKVPEMDGRYLRVILLPDGETVHNAFFDRRYKA